jgi:hypothetical protein
MRRGDDEHGAGSVLAFLKVITWQLRCDYGDSSLNYQSMTPAAVSTSLKGFLKKEEAAN